MDNNSSHSKGNVCLDPNVCGIWQGMTSFVNKDVSIYQGILLPLWMCWLFSPISHLMTWAEQSIHSANVQNSEKGTVWGWSLFRAAQCQCSFSEVTSPLHLSKHRSKPKCYFTRTLYKKKKCVFYHPVDKRGISEVAFRTMRQKNKRKVGQADFSDTIWSPEHWCQKVRYSEVKVLTFFQNGPPDHSPVSHPQSPPGLL